MVGIVVLAQNKAAGTVFLKLADWASESGIAVVISPKLKN
jgi:hypothetical protein